MTEDDARRFLREVLDKIKPFEVLEVIESLPESAEKDWLLGLLVEEFKKSETFVLQ